MLLLQKVMVRLLISGWCECYAPNVCAPVSYRGLHWLGVVDDFAAIWLLNEQLIADRSLSIHRRLPGGWSTFAGTVRLTG